MSVTAQQLYEKQLQLPTAHQDISPLPLTLTRQADDFIVHELQPLPEPGNTYCWFRVKHRNLGTLSAVKQISQALSISKTDVTWSGRKDKDATVTQWLSCHCDLFDEKKLPIHIELLESVTSKIPLSLGTHPGNQFEIFLSTQNTCDPGTVMQWATRLSNDGFPNYFGLQRFGDSARGLERASALLSSEKMHLGRESSFLLHMWQAAIFNLILERWILDGRPLTDADLVWHRQAHAVVKRKLCPEGTIMAPLPGSKTYDQELDILDTLGWPKDMFLKRAAKLKLHGCHRQRWIIPHDLKLQPETDGIRVYVTLPAGCYATSLIREFTRRP